jgi:3-oxoacyl-[acyl-carrier-protein] synthase III
VSGRTADIGVEVAGWGTALPARIISNAELSQLLALDVEPVAGRAGIRERRWVSDGEGTGSLASRAASAALVSAGVDPTDLRLIALATATPEFAGFPATAALIQDAIGAVNAGAFDIGAGCSAFLYALTLVSEHVRSTRCPALVVASEAFSRVLDTRDPLNAGLFGDGAAALVLKPVERSCGPLASRLRSDGAGAIQAHINYREHVLRLDGRAAARAMLERLPPTICESLASAGLTPTNVDLFVPHDTNVRLSQQLLDRVGIGRDRLATELPCLGNTATATVPIALAHAAARGRIRRGDTLLLSAFGAGYAWGSVVWRW